MAPAQSWGMVSVRSLACVALIAFSLGCNGPAQPQPTPAPTGLPIAIPLPDVATRPPAIANGPHQDNGEPAPRVSAPSLAVVDEASGELLYSVNPFERRAPASITKIATTIVALERGPEVHT